MRPLFLSFALLAFASSLYPQSAPPSSWTSVELPFHPIAVTVAGSTFWACGSGTGIAESADGYTWQIKRQPVEGGALLLGIRFAGAFGFSFGTGGTLLTSADGGNTWTEQQLGTETILLASFVDARHGVFRTSSSLFYVSGGEPTSLPLPKDVPADFRYVPALASLSASKAIVELSEGWRSRAGFVATNDGGGHWTFYEPPHVVTYDLLRAKDEFWAVGTETVDYDKPGGGYGVPAVLESPDGLSWKHSAADPRPCHWQGCHACNDSGCLASSTLLINPFEGSLRMETIPTGHLTAKWAATPDVICSVDGSLYCAPLSPATDVSKQGEPQPDNAHLPPLGTPAAKGLLRCISCGLDPVYVDKKASGRTKIELSLVVNSDGTISSVDVENAPSDTLKEHLKQQVSAWLFEPPKQNGNPIRVKNKSEVEILVMHSR